MPRRSLAELFEPSPQLERIRAKAVYNSDKIIEKYFQVPREKDGAPVDFNLRWIQRKVYEIYQEELRSGKPVRLWLLKSRRVGTTTLFAADDYIDAWARPNRSVGIVAHRDDRASEILDLCKFFHRHMHPKLRVPMSRDSAERFKFADNHSKIAIGTCKEPQKVRGGGLHRVHLSEAAWYRNQFNVTLRECATTIAPEPGTVGIIETTGFMRGSQAYQHWRASREGDTVWRAEFLDWQSDPTCYVPFESERQRDIILAEMAAVEPRLREKFMFYKLTAEQMHWAYREYLYRCEQDYEYFCREFPMSEEEAWDAHGSSFFGDNEIATMATRVVEPLMFSFGNRFINQLFRSFSELTPVAKHDHTNGTLVIKLWALPQPGRTYVAASDVSLGENAGAYSVGYVIDALTREKMCSFRGRIRPDEHAFLLASLGWIYNTAILAPEVNPGGGGMQVLNDLQRIGYHRIYIWRLRDDKRGIVLSNKLGWITNTLTRPLMLQELRKMFMDCAHDRFPDPGMFRDAIFIDECRTFQRDPETGKIEAMGDEAYDDAIMALAIAHRVAADEVHGTSTDLYASYNAEKGSEPFAQLLAHYDAIANGGDPTDVVDFLTGAAFDMDPFGSIRWHEDV